MDKFKQKLFKRLAVLGGIFASILFVYVITLIYADSNYLSGFMSGLLWSTGAVFLVYLLRYYRAIKNPDTLRKLQILEEDERNLLIAQKVQSHSFQLFVLIIAILAIVFAFIDRGKMFVLVSLLWIACIVKIGLYCYYKRKL